MSLAAPKQEAPGAAAGAKAALPAARLEESTPMGPSSAPTRLEELPRFVAGVMGGDSAMHLECTTQFRKLLSIERFVEFLNYDANAPLQLEAAWALTNIIASGTSDHTQVVIANGALPIFARLLSSPNDDVREQAVWALGNVAGDSLASRNLVLETGAMAPLLQQLTENSKLSMLRNATWTLSSLCKGTPPPDFNLLRPALPTLAQLVASKDDDVLTVACRALS
jgi:HEAT repeat protein